MILAKIKRVYNAVAYRVLSRMLPMPVFHSPIAAFLKNNPEALFRMLDHPGSRNALLAQNHLLNKLLSTKTLARKALKNKYFVNAFFDQLVDLTKDKPERYNTAFEKLDSTFYATLADEDGKEKISDYFVGRADLLTALISHPDFKIQSRKPAFRKVLVDYFVGRIDFLTVLISHPDFKIQSRKPAFRETLMERTDVLPTLVADAALARNLVRSKSAMKVLQHAVVSEEPESTALSCLPYMSNGSLLSLQKRQAASHQWANIVKHTNYSKTMRDKVKDAFVNTIKNDDLIDMAEIMKIISPDHVVPLKGGDFTICGYDSFITIMEEILVNEEYYFEPQRPDPFIIDCGSNVGLSIYYFKNLYPEAVIVAFEPVSELCKITTENVKNLGFKDVTLHEAALAGKAGEMTMQISQYRDLAGHIKGRRSATTGEFQERAVKTEVLSSHIDRPVDMIKMDIEGAELEVIRELGDKLKLVRNFICEFHMDGDKDMDGLIEFQQLLRDAGMLFHIAPSAWAEQYRGRRPINHIGKKLSLSIVAHNPAWQNAIEEKNAAE